MEVIFICMILFFALKGVSLMLKGGQSFLGNNPDIGKSAAARIARFLSGK